MAATAKKLDYITVEDYLTGEKTSEVRHEYVECRNAGWRSSYYFLGDELTLESVNVTLPVEAIYERVQNKDMAAWLEEQKQL
ncbi:hypothetical protein [Thiothrix nivea]|uniref:Uncharacterized protein n=1 Tax=Thiothrix nivea (strain ATCC 35100 / DSM 5205 / JP2) TaxID=870187 RepID=A0A656HC15_THINJ|nr:hypothetical protein [Thiothrix nivea]EIJ33712.1 hypothetical protein Thini_1091 [Thiothrix nivea DSM 5205]